MNDLISRQAAIDELNNGAELLRRVLDDTDVVGVERAKYEWGLGLIESYISDMEEVPSAETEIIRCKDCKYSEPYDGSTKATLRLKCLYRSGVLENWFCEHGERR